MLHNGLVHDDDDDEGDTDVDSDDADNDDGDDNADDDGNNHNYLLQRQAPLEGKVRAVHLNKTPIKGGKTHLGFTKVHQ